MKIITLDTNCFIDTFTPGSHAYSVMQTILKAHKSKQIKITVSLHTLSEIKGPSEAIEFAKTVEILPHYPIGRFCDQIAKIKDLAGTWGDAKKNQAMQDELAQLAKSGNDIRDRGAYIDAINAKVDAFITSDAQLVRNGPAGRIKDKFGVRVISPMQLASELA